MASNTPNQSFQAPYQVRVTPLGQFTPGNNTGTRITPMPAQFQGTGSPGNTPITTGK